MSFKPIGSGEGYVALVDFDSAVTAGSIITYNLLFVALPPRTIEDRLMHYMIQEEKLDCRQQTIQVLSVTAYGMDDKLIGKDESASPPEIIFPESLPESQFNLLCKGAKPSSTAGEFKSLAAAVKAGDEYINEHVSGLAKHP
jgi:hypothetical protein